MRTELRQFGLLWGGVFALLFGFVLPWIFARQMQLWPWILGGVICLVALLVPQFLRSFYYLWMKFGAWIGWINSKLILSLFFYLIICPVALIMKLTGRDPMRRRWDSQAKSYRIPKERSQMTSMERPF